MRSDRLKDTELSKVEEHFREHPLFTACQRAFKSYQANMAPLLFAHGEVFYEAAIIIDYLHQIPQTDEVKTYIADLWNDLRIKLSKLQGLLRWSIEQETSDHCHHLHINEESSNENEISCHVVDCCGNHGCMR